MYGTTVRGLCLNVAFSVLGTSPELGKTRSRKEPILEEPKLEEEPKLGEEEPKLGEEEEEEEEEGSRL